MKTVDIPINVPVQVDENVLTYGVDRHLYMLRFPARPAAATIGPVGRDGRRTVTISTLTRAVLSVVASPATAEAVFVAVGGVLPDA